MKKFFTFRNQKYEYLNHAHNYAWLNERAVEVPIIQKIIMGCRQAEILEVGNVLSYYPGWQAQCVLDKYEVKKENVVNADIVNFIPKKKYHLVVSISTMEHVGYDETAYGGNSNTIHSQKIPDSIDNIKTNILRPGGRFVFTVPLGYNKIMDSQIFKNELGLKTVYYMRRISSDNRWQECTIDKVRHSEYGTPYQFANAIAICTLYIL